MKKTLHAFLSVLVCAFILCSVGITADAATTGTCGKNLKWSLNSSGRLEISGKGSMYNYEVYGAEDKMMPWVDHLQKIKSVVIKEGVTSIGNSAFRTCTALETVKLPSTLKTIGDSSFYGCSSLEKFVAPDNLTSIGDYAFIYCYKLKEVTLSKKLTSIGESSFYCCNTLKEITIPDSVTKLGPSAFAECQQLTKVKLSSKLKVIDEGTFGCCFALKEITIPDSVTKIEGWSFSSCDSLETLTFPKSVAYIGESAIFGVENTVILNPDCEIYDAKGSLSGNIIGYAGSTAQAYAKKYHLSFSVIKPEATTKISASQTTTTITLKWNKVTGADGYRVYKYNTETKKYEKLKDVTGTTLKISKLKAGTAYKYKVRAYTKYNGTIWGAYSSAFETATKCKTPTLKLTSSKKGVASIAWSNVAGESGYQVYGSSKKDSGYKKLSSYKANVTKGSKNKLKSKKTYYFRVRAYKKTASGTVYSAWSDIKSIKIK